MWSWSQLWCMRHGEADVWYLRSVQACQTARPARWVQSRRGRLWGPRGVGSAPRWTSQTCPGATGKSRQTTSSLPPTTRASPSSLALAPMARYTLPLQRKTHSFGTISQPQDSGCAALLGLTSDIESYSLICTLSHPSKAYLCHRSNCRANGLVETSDCWMSQIKKLACLGKDFERHDRVSKSMRLRRN